MTTSWPRALPLDALPLICSTFTVAVAISILLGWPKTIIGR
jgi:hypothetical protein